MSKRIGLSGAALKAIACVLMLIDHAGMLLFPSAEWMRCVGRLAFPLFAFFIAEGCRYTGNRARYLIRIALLGIVCETAYMLSGSSYYGNILLTFSLSIGLVYLWQECQAQWQTNKPLALFWGVIFVLAIGAVWLFTDTFGTDYGFWGVMVAVLISLAHSRQGDDAFWYRAEIRLAILAIALAFVALQPIAPARQWWSLVALPLLTLYNGTAGNARFQYGFYVFYPLHLLVLQLIAWVI